MAQHDIDATDIISRRSITSLISVHSAPVRDGLPDPPMKLGQDIIIEIPPTSAADDEAFVAALVEIINAAYTETEGDIFKPGYLRTSGQDIATLLRSSELAVASQHTSSGGRIPLGCISIQKLGETRAELGLFAVVAELRGNGLGRDLLEFAEQHCLSELGDSGAVVTQLNVLFPKHFEHPFKIRLQKWYMKLGYQIVRHRDFLLDYPQLAPLLTGPTEYRMLEKKLV
ncbi:hypothetical protein GL218_03920 [Daldinia childiae]|uniref:uncharacterized protein n=1 Tax=Daldinia childiae TaxID=326645 RepID=UPI001447FCB8|nr:uncharacterized protein GL218_03920 [Daldinia childiae]KAF3061435.1 hypothetical protein GL218_03920 [Daldinia childiae]